jgi:ADP-ribose pyrophosphatase YjhB (NUDIX family)
MTSRRIFDYDDLEETKIISSLTAKKQLYDKTISACGSLFYKKQSKELLLISYADPGWPNYDDFGGRVDEDDESVFDTIIRETTEETNDIISKAYMKKIIKSNNHKTFYTQFCKYYFILVEVPENFHPDTTTFGNMEKTDKIKRTIDWVPYSKAKLKLAVRLKKCQELINFLDTELSDPIVSKQNKPTKGFPMGLNV